MVEKSPTWRVADWLQQPVVPLAAELQKVHLDLYEVWVVLGASACRQKGQTLKTGRASTWRGACHSLWDVSEKLPQDLFVCVLQQDHQSGFDVWGFILFEALSVRIISNQLGGKSGTKNLNQEVPVFWRKEQLIVSSKCAIKVQVCLNPSVDALTQKHEVSEYQSPSRHAWISSSFLSSAAWISLESWEKLWAVGGESAPSLFASWERAVETLGVK